MSRQPTKKPKVEASSDRNQQLRRRRALNSRVEDVLDCEFVDTTTATSFSSEALGQRLVSTESSIPLAAPKILPYKATLSSNIAWDHELASQQPSEYGEVPIIYVAEALLVDNDPATAVRLSIAALWFQVQLY
jgi:hypothetical protein